MDTKIFGVVVRVRNLELCRAFYRDVLDLGTSLLDSNFWVEFRLGSSRLCLEKIEWEDESAPKEDQGGESSSSSSGISWILMVKDLEDFANRIAAYGYAAESKACDSFGFSLLRFRDPEGNPFLVSAERTPNAGQETGKGTGL